MSATHLRHLHSFETYLEHEGARPLEGDNIRCEGCNRTDLKCWVVYRPGTNPSVDCEACLRYRWGYDEAQAYTVSAMLTGAIVGLIDRADTEVCDAAVAEALEDAKAARAKLLGERA